MEWESIAYQDMFSFNLLCLVIQDSPPRADGSMVKAAENECVPHMKAIPARH